MEWSGDTDCGGLDWILGDSPWGSGTVKNLKNIWRKSWVMFCTGCLPDKKSCVPKLDFLPGQMHRRMSVSAQGFAKDNLHWVNSGD